MDYANVELDLFYWEYHCAVEIQVDEHQGTINIICLYKLSLNY